MDAHSIDLRGEALLGLLAERHLHLRERHPERGRLPAAAGRTVRDVLFAELSALEQERGLPGGRVPSAASYYCRRAALRELAGWHAVSEELPEPWPCLLSMSAERLRACCLSIGRRICRLVLACGDEAAELLARFPRGLVRELLQSDCGVHRDQGSVAYAKTVARTLPPEARGDRRVYLLGKRTLVAVHAALHEEERRLIACAARSSLSPSTLGPVLATAGDDAIRAPGSVADLTGRAVRDFVRSESQRDS